MFLFSVVDFDSCSPVCLSLCFRCVCVLGLKPCYPVLKALESERSERSERNASKSSPAVRLLLCPLLVVLLLLLERSTTIAEINLLINIVVPSLFIVVGC